MSDTVILKYPDNGGRVDDFWGNLTSVSIEPVLFGIILKFQNISTSHHHLYLNLNKIIIK